MFVDAESSPGILISVKVLIMAALGGAGCCSGLVGAAPEEISNNLLGARARV